MLLKQEIDCFLTQRLCARFQIKGEVPQLTPGDRIEIDREHPLTSSTWGPPTRRVRIHRNRHPGRRVLDNRFGRRFRCKKAGALGMLYAAFRA